MSQGRASLFSRFVLLSSHQERANLTEDARNEAIACVARDGVTLRKFILESPSGQSYPAFLFEPPTFGGDPPCAIIYCASELVGQSQPEAVLFAQRVVPMGISVFVLGLTGAHSALYEPGTVNAAVKFLQALDDASYERVALWGRSAGAVAALRAAVEDPSLTALVCDSAYSNLISLLDLPKWLEKKFADTRREKDAARAHGDESTRISGKGVEVHTPEDFKPIDDRCHGGGECSADVPEFARRPEFSRHDDEDLPPLEIEGGVTVISEPFDLNGWISSVSSMGPMDFDVNAWMSSSTLSEEPPISLAARCYVPAMLMHGKDDNVVPISDCQALAREYAGEIMAFHIEDLNHDTPRYLPHMARALLFLLRMFGKDGRNPKLMTILAEMAAVRRCVDPLPQAPRPPLDDGLDLEISGQLQSDSASARRRALLLAALAALPEHEAANLREVDVPSTMSAFEPLASGRPRILSRIEGKVLLPTLADEVEVAWVISNDEDGDGGSTSASPRRSASGAVYFLSISVQLLKLSTVYFEPVDSETKREDDMPKYIVEGPRLGQLGHRWSRGLRMYVEHTAVQAVNHFPSQVPLPVELVVTEDSARQASLGGARLDISFKGRIFTASASSSSSSSSQECGCGEPLGVSFFGGDFQASASVSHRPRLELEAVPLGSANSFGGHVFPALQNSGQSTDGLPTCGKVAAITSSSHDPQGILPGATLLTNPSLVSRQDGSLTHSGASTNTFVNRSDRLPSCGTLTGPQLPGTLKIGAAARPPLAPLTGTLKIAESMGSKAEVDAPEVANDTPTLQQEGEVLEDVAQQEVHESEVATELPFVTDLLAGGFSNWSWPEEQGSACHRLENRTWAAPGGFK